MNRNFTDLLLVAAPNRKILEVASEMDASSWLVPMSQHGFELIGKPFACAMTGPLPMMPNISVLVAIPCQLNMLSIVPVEASPTKDIMKFSRDTTAEFPSWCLSQCKHRAS